MSPISTSSPLFPRRVKFTDNLNSDARKLCASTIFDMVSINDLPSFPDNYPPEWKERLKPVIDQHQKSFGYIQNPDDETLDAFLTSGINLLKELLEKCSPQWHAVIKKKQPLDINTLLRENLEQNPALKSSDDFVSDLHSLLSIVNKNCPTQKQIQYHLFFLKQLSLYPSNKEGYKFYKPDSLLLFLIQFGKCLYTPNTAPHLIHFLLEECKNKIVLTQIKKALKNKAPLLKKKNNNHLSLFIYDLYGISKCFGEKTFTYLLKILSQYIQDYQCDQRTPSLIKISHSLWKNSGQTIFGIIHYLEKTLINNEACSFFDSHSLLISHNAAITEFENRFLSRNPPRYRNVAANLLYRTWWFYKYRKVKPTSLIDREIDWLTHDLLVGKERWDLAPEVVAQCVEKSFRKANPLLPFNQHRALETCFSLQFARRKSLENRDMPFLIPPEEKSEASTPNGQCD